MKKLELNKKTISQLDRKQMRTINGGDDAKITIPLPCLSSCPNAGTTKSKACCGGKCTKYD